MVNPTGYTALDMIGFTDQGTYSSSDNYVKNDLVHYSGNIWRCLIDDTSGIAPAEGANWTLFIGEPTNLVERIIAPVETDPATNAWAIGRQIIFNDNLYEVITAITAGDSLVTHEDDPTNANIKLADPVETQLLNEESTRAAADLSLQNALSHRNLLDNAWFTVNQRGQTSYPGLGYTVDRWASEYYDTSVITVNSDGISWSVKSDLNQKVPMLLELLGKEVTISALINGVVYSETVTLGSTTSSGWSAAVKLGPDSVTFDVYYHPAFASKNCFEFRFRSNAGLTYPIKAVKLELGSVSTLAQDTAPNYATELLKCQRYYYRFYNAKQNNSPNFHGYLASTNVAVAAVDLPVPMRALPTMASSCKFRVLTFEGIVVADKTPSSYSLTLLNPSHLGDVKQISMILNFAAADSIATKSLVPVDVLPLGSDDYSDTYVEFSADL